MDIDNIKSSVDSIPKLHQDIANIRAEISHSSQAMPVINAANMEEVIHEAQERMLRSKNLLFFNVPESNNISADHGMIINLLKEIPVDTRSIFISKIGNPSSNHLRPIAVTFSNSQDPHPVMRNRNKIPGRVIVGFDKTENQQAQYKEVAAKFKTRLDSEDCEQAYVMITFQSTKKLISGCTYLPPASPASIYKDHIYAVHQVSESHGDCDWIVLGDFNVPGVNWINSPNLAYDFVGNRTARNAECADIIRNGYSFMNMNQYFPVPYNKGYSLDLLFSSISNISSFHAPETLSTVDDHHIPIMFKVELASDVVQDKVLPKSEQFDFS
ncbi:hypothetical protein QAD02_013382 [Eretmocerus hayati]|uniref:Uncharacterized protein n=1 Tax=Eretmocerus hayati TaxID=131215 RepID=A0ACC2P735_9HYME|nr:hypothetical protein QAD02_013382 [Eretmocerus hayati]